MIVQEYRAAIAEASRPLRERLIDIEAELTSLREEKIEIEAILRKTDQLPEKKVYPKKSQSLTPVSEETVGKVLRWLDTNLNGDEFHASGLPARGFDVTSASQLSKALNVLHDRNQITLVRMGQGGSKIYRVVS